MTASEIRAYVDPMREEFADPRSLILPALKYAQTERGHLTTEDLAAVAEAIDLSPAYVESVASFYDRIYLHPTGTRVVSVCVTLSCMLRGSDELLEHICEREGLPHEGGTSEDGAVTVQEAQCLGYCDRALPPGGRRGDPRPHVPRGGGRAARRAARDPPPDRLWR